MILSLVLVATLISCGNNNASTGHHQNKTDIAQQSPSVPKQITVYRYGDFSPREARQLADALSEYFPHVVFVDEPLALPHKYYNRERNRYQGTGLLRHLTTLRKDDCVLGLTGEIIFKGNELSPTFGIMGLSPVGTYVCLLSDKIPKGGKTHTADNLTKLALHELGHAFGLQHCARDEQCYMQDAEHKMKFPQTTHFCDSCKKPLMAKGWSFN